MAPTFHNDAFDAALDKIATCTRVDLCTTEPTNLTEATSTYTVANYTLTAGDGNGDWTVADGDASGRKVTLAAQSGNNGTGTGSADFAAFSDGSTLLAVIAGSGETVNSGSPVTIAETDVWEIADPS